MTNRHDHGGADLPEGVIDADPPGGWESGAIADDETAEQSREAEGSPELTDAYGVEPGSEYGDERDAESGAAPSQDVETTSPGGDTDPDLIHEDDRSEQGS
ncbi:hypothetical protein M4I32_04575 [Microbacterium sp. LRZ72]|uniref:hypothetical protein n=1 Tax=Microbacterium sp. LRZ72 TaxID=2942481 RepID=UPI0029AEB6A1|nr:hypothetical protein [Microbacterium sp. LRZ72]MDX2376072.1 hypothetical protein [Microbacterium sp. LRZ72]